MKFPFKPDDKSNDPLKATDVSPNAQALLIDIVTFGKRFHPDITHVQFDYDKDAGTIAVVGIVDDFGVAHNFVEPVPVPMTESLKMKRQQSLS